MTDEPMDTGPDTMIPPDDTQPGDNPVKAVRYGPLADLSDLRRDGRADGWRILIPELLPLASAVAIYSKAFLETLAKRHADGLADLVRSRIRKKGKPDEIHIGVDGSSAATIVVTADMPDEARLALLDLDVTADELRGKLLRWDDSTLAWRPSDDK